MVSRIEGGSPTVDHNVINHSPNATITVSHSTPTTAPSPIADRYTPRSSNTPLTVYYQNVGGMRSKTNDFFLATASCEYDVIVLTETWLRSDVSNSELSSDYNIFRCDRSSASCHFSRGGGVLIAVKKAISSLPVRLERCNSLEQIVVKLRLQSKSVYVCGIYLRPNSDPDKYAAHADSVQQIMQKTSDGDSVLIIGDYNLPHLHWAYDDDLDSHLPTNASSEQELVFTENMIASGLLQICDVRNSNDRLLDLAFVSNSSEVELFEVPFSILPPDRHHKPFVLRLFTSELEASHAVSAQHDFNFNRCNYNAVIEELSLFRWEELFQETDVNAAVANFYNVVFGVIRRHTPLRRSSPRRPNSLPWWNADLRRRRNVLRKVRRRFLQHRSEENRSLLRRLEAEYNECVSSSFREYIFRIEDEVKADPSVFWRFFKERKGAQSLPSEMSFGGITSHSPTESVELFADFFKSVYNPSSPLISADALDLLPSFDIHFPCPTFSIADVTEALNAIDSSKGPGSDKLPPVFIKRCAEVLAIPVCRLFNLSLTEAIFPDAWKLSAITPIHKAGNLHKIENYRPISILCCLAKTFERLIHDRMYSAAKPLISQYQHGFMKNRSTTTNLMAYVSSLNLSMEKRFQVDSIYVDFSKAFDKVPHDLTLRKLDRLGFPDWFINWLRSYLRDRTAYVNLKSVESTRFPTPSGVPQGSHLGPLIFIIFVNDLIDRINSHRLMYADDLKIYRIISSSIDCAALQQDIDTVSSWCVLNGMEMNAIKCKVISFTKSRAQMRFDYSANGTLLDRVKSIKDLGVVMDEKLNFNEHVAATTAKAFAVLGFIRRNASEFRDPYALKSAYCSLVRSILEYAVQVWAPYHETQIARIERVQRCFVRYALRRLPWSNPIVLPAYDSRRQLIGLESLRHRRVYLQRMFAYDVISSRIDCPELLQQANFFVPARLLRQRSLIRISRHRTVFGQNHPLEKCFNLLNDVDIFDFTIDRNRFKNIVRQIY